MAKKTFILYDGRAKDGNTDDASVLVVASSEEEAQEQGETTWEGYDAIWFEYDNIKGWLKNEKARWDLSPACPPAERIAAEKKFKRKHRRRRR